MEKVQSPNGATVSYEKSGSGPPLVLVHGSLNNHTTAWMLVKPMLDAQFTVYAIDRRGRGETSATEGHTIPEEAQDVAAVIDAIGEPVFLLGHSFGGQVALAATALAPDRVLKLVLYEPPWPHFMAENLVRMQEIMRTDGAEPMVDSFLGSVIKVPRDELNVLKATPFWQFLVADAENTIREWPGLAAYDFDPMLFSSLKLPVLLLAGTKSHREDYVTDALLDALPNVREFDFQDQGHTAQGLAPQLFADTVISFLTEE